MQLKNSRNGNILASNDTNAERRKKPSSQISNLEDLKFGLFLERILSPEYLRNYYKES